MCIKANIQYYLNAESPLTLNIEFTWSTQFMSIVAWAEACSWSDSSDSSARGKKCSNHFLIWIYWWWWFKIFLIYAAESVPGGVPIFWIKGFTKVSVMPSWQQVTFVYPGTWASCQALQLCHQCSQSIQEICCEISTPRVWSHFFLPSCALMATIICRGFGRGYAILLGIFISCVFPQLGANWS